MMGQKFIERVCPQCEKSYMADESRLKHGRQTTCSRKCSYDLRANKLFTSENKTCPICSKSFTRPNSQKALSGPSYCSKACYAIGQHLKLTIKPTSIYSEEGKERQRENGRKMILLAHKKLKQTNYAATKTPERRMQQSILMEKRIREGKISKVSKIENDVVEFLMSHGINCSPQHKFRDAKNGQFVAIADIYIEEKNTVIEINGTYWHADPRFYEQDSMSLSQLRTKKFYDRKIKYFNDEQIKVIEVWEYDIRNKSFCANLIEALNEIS